MGSRDENFYAAWREGNRLLALRDGEGTPPEKLLQAVWLHQRLKRDELKTADGKPVRVLHPGFPSAEGGPDFRGAVLKFGGEPSVAGDVEVDLRPSGWRAHGHDTNPSFKNVILHVIWEEVQSPRSKAQSQPAVLALKNYLDAPFPELALALENESGLPEKLRGKCSAPLRGLSGTKLSELLHAAGKVRFENKAKAILARAKICGWEQALWENLFRALGYKHNTWAMQNLAETKSCWMDGGDPPSRFRKDAAQAPCHSHSIFELQARMLGISGLLPDDLTHSQKSSDTFLRRAWDCWWRDRDEFSDRILPRAVWRLHGLRPANHPQRRLALAAHWLASENLMDRIENWIAAGSVSRAGAPASRRQDAGAPGDKVLRSLQEIFQVKHDEFWSWHWTFKSPRLARPQPLLGAGRVTDLAINVVLPWLWIRPQGGGSEKIRCEVERRFFAWPAAGDNSVLKLARQRLLGTSSAKILKGAAQQQGLMQIVRDFCEHSNATCAECRFPGLVRNWAGV